MTQKHILPEIIDANKTNTEFLRSHRDVILKNFPQFKNNPNTEIAPNNFSIRTKVQYHLLNDIYGDHQGKIPNPKKTQLHIGFTQNFNHTYTGSLWDLPLASLYCKNCFESGQIIDEVAIATQAK